VKLPRSLVKYVSHQLVEALVREGAIDVEDRAAAAEGVSTAFVEDLTVEDRLNEEVRQIMNDYADEMNRRGVNYHEMFKKIKQELIRQRKLIL
jgi:hypothetical protein